MYEDRFDEVEWTFACRFTPGGDANADYAAHLPSIDRAVAAAALAHARLAVLIHQAPGVPPPDANWRSLVAAQTAKPSFRPICCAIVTENVLMRGVLTAMNWLRPREYQESVFGDSEAALAWLERCRGATLPGLRAAVARWFSAAPGPAAGAPGVAASAGGARPGARGPRRCG